jgi:pilus assembly protein Flp/PilA
MLTNLKALWLDESGQDLAEYALLLALIAIIVIAALTLLGPAISNLFNTITTSLNSAGGS